MKNKKTLFVGLDAACWEFYQPLLDAGNLPALQSLIDRGMRGELRSTMPAWTPAAWASISTGKNPGKHGIYDMMWLRPESYESFPTNSRVRLGTPFWTRLNQGGVRTGLVNVPFTHPPDAVDGFVVTGFGAPSGKPDFAYPAEARDWILENFGPYEPWLRFSELKESGPRGKINRDLSHQANQVAIALRLSEMMPVDVLVINLMAPDHANHLLPEKSQVQQVIIDTDKELGRLLDGFQPESVMLFSDHGSRRVKGDFLLHTWLRDHGYMVQQDRDPDGRKNVLNAILVKYLREGMGWPRPIEVPVRRAGLAVFSLLSAAQKERFWDRIERKLPEARNVYQLANNLDTRVTPWFMGSSRSGLLYVNLKGRRPDGVVEEAAYSDTVQELAEQLRAIKDPDGVLIFNAVHTKEEIYHGPAAIYAPDLTLDFYDSPWNVLHTFRRGAYVERLTDRYFVGNKGEYGHHSRNGLFVFAGPEFLSGVSPHIGDMVDLPATLLHLHEQRLPDDWDGQVLLNTLTEESRARPVQYQPGDPKEELDFAEMYTEEENEELVARLEALGYL